jgi:hypothetical protein
LLASPRNHRDGNSNLFLAGPPTPWPRGRRRGPTSGNIFFLAAACAGRLG